MKNTDLLKRIKEEADKRTPDLFDEIMSSAKEQGIVNSASAAKIGTAHASAASAGAGTAAGGTKIIISSIIAALAVTAAVGGTVGASLAVNSANQPSSSTPPPVIENPNPPENTDPPITTDPPEIVVGTEGLKFMRASTDSYFVAGKGTATDAVITIPSHYDGKPVTAIGSEAFKNDDNITEVILPYTVTGIAPGAFKNCSALSKVTLSENLQKVAKEAFLNTALTGDLIFSETITEISESAFYGNGGLVNIQLPDKPLTIGQNAFAETGYYANSGNWDNDVLYIGKHLIRGRETLSGTCTVRTDTIDLADRAFNGCKNLSWLNVGADVVRIGEGVLAFCTGINGITVDANNQVYHVDTNCIIETDRNKLICGCSTESIPDTVREIADYAFYGARGKTFSTSSDSLREIGEFAFSCSEIESVYISTNYVRMTDGYNKDDYLYIINRYEEAIYRLVLIGNTFVDCVNLKTVEIENAYCDFGYQYTFKGCTELEDITFSGDNRVERLSGGMFTGCKKLIILNLPADIDPIHDGFIYGSSIGRIYYAGTQEQWKEVSLNYQFANTTLRTVVCDDGYMFVYN